MGQPYWTETSGAEQWVADIGDASPWDTATLGGVQLPGLVEVDFDTSRKIDVKNGPGLDGATETHQGYDPAPVTIKILMWTPSHWDAWQVLVPTIQPKMGKAGKNAKQPLILAHPAAASMGIDAVLIESISSPKKTGQAQFREVTIKALQWLKPKKAAIFTPLGDVTTQVATQPSAFTSVPSVGGNVPYRGP